MPAGTPPEILKAWDDVPGKDGRGILRLTWATSRAVTRDISMGAHGSAPMEFIEPDERIEEIPYGDTAERDRLALKYFHGTIQQYNELHARRGALARQLLGRPESRGQILGIKRGPAE